MPINVTKKWLLGENANAGISGVGSGTPSLGSGSTFPAGIMLQTVHAFATTATVISSTDMTVGTDTTLTATITPSVSYTHLRAHET